MSRAMLTPVTTSSTVTPPLSSQSPGQRSAAVGATEAVALGVGTGVSMTEAVGVCEAVGAADDVGVAV
jgi:hypothetical protein